MGAMNRISGVLRCLSQFQIVTSVTPIFSQLENLCRYVARPAVATERLSKLSDGRILYRLRHQWRDGCHLTKSHTAPIYVHRFARIKVNGFLGVQTCPGFSALAAFCDPAEIASRTK
jgi:hypothetical protein